MSVDVHTGIYLSWSSSWGVGCAGSHVQFSFSVLFSVCLVSREHRVRAETCRSHEQKKNKKIDAGSRVALGHQRHRRILPVYGKWFFRILLQVPALTGTNIKYQNTGTGVHGVVNTVFFQSHPNYVLTKGFFYCPWSSPKKIYEHRTKRICSCQLCNVLKIS